MEIKMVWHWQKDRHIDDWNTVGSPEIGPTKIWPIDFWQSVKALWERENNLFSKWRWLSIHMQKMNLDLYFIPYITINSKCIIDLNVKCETIKLLEEGIRENLWYEVRQRILRHDTKSMAIKEKKWINWTSQKLKAFAMWKTLLRELKIQVTDQE